MTGDAARRANAVSRPTGEPAARPARARGRRARVALRAAIALAALALLVWTRAFTRWPQVYYMTGASMEPAVRAHDYFLASSPPGPLRRGMLVIFRYEDEDGVFHVLRRVAGLPGDTVAMQDGIATVDGRIEAWPFRIVEPRASRSPLARVSDLYTWGPLVVPRDSVYLLADTRDMIGWPDSRFIGPVPVSTVEASAGRIVWPPGRLLHRLQP